MNLKLVKAIFYFLIISFVLVTNIRKFKSNDLDFKYSEAVKFYENREFIKAFPLFDELLLLYRNR